MHDIWMSIVQEYTNLRFFLKSDNRRIIIKDTSGYFGRWNRTSFAWPINRIDAFSTKGMRALEKIGFFFESALTVSSFNAILQCSCAAECRITSADYKISCSATALFWSVTVVNFEILQTRIHTSGFGWIFRLYVENLRPMSPQTFNCGYMQAIEASWQMQKIFD